MPMDVTGGALFAPWWRSSLTTGWSASGKWAAGASRAKTPFAHSNQLCLVGIPADWRNSGSALPTPPPRFTTIIFRYFAALEFACLDLLGQAWGAPVSEILGGRLRDRIEFASYLFFRYSNPKNGGGEVRTVNQLVSHAQELKSKHGFKTHKLKGGVFPPPYELECYRAIAEAFPGDHLRFDPNCTWSTEQGIQFARAIEGLNNDYLEDPVFGLNGMRQVREKARMALATNTTVVNFEQLATNVRDPAVDVVLLDTTFWGGIRPCLKAAGICDTFQLGVSVHSSGELGIQLASMLHMASLIPNLSLAADAHYHELVDDIIEGGKFHYQDGAICVPTGAGLGVRVDREKLVKYGEMYRRLGPYHL